MTQKEKKEMIYNYAKEAFPEINIESSDLADALFIMGHFKKKA